MTDENDTRHQKQDALERGLAALRHADGHPEPELVARVLADAQAVQTKRRDAPATALAARPAPWWQVCAALLGGRQGIAGLASVALAGVWIGAYPPASVAALGSSLWGVSVIVQIDDEPLFELDD